MKQYYMIARVSSLDFAAVTGGGFGEILGH